MCARLTGSKVDELSPLGRRHSQDAILREPRFAAREVGTEELAALRGGNAKEHR